MSATVKFSFRVPVELAQALREIAARQDRSVSAEIRRVIRRHVEAERVNASGRPTTL